MSKQQENATARALMVLVEDLQDFETAAERMRAQIAALAKRHGVSLPRRPIPSNG
jgi:hypothetical protein